MKKFYCNGKNGICENKNCTNCKKFNNTGGNYIEVDENLKQTNFDRITESVESLAEFVLNLTKECHYRGCEKCVLQDCQCYDVTKIKEWLQKEIDDENI